MTNQIECLISSSGINRGESSIQTIILSCAFSIRREVYKILNANGVETPRYEVCNRDEVCNHDGAETSGSDGKEGGESCDGGGKFILHG